MTESVRKRWDFFVSYASEDRQEAAFPLAEELRRRGYEVWLDQFVISPGEPFRDKIQEGLSLCHFGVVVLSPVFLRKDWPKRELDVLLAIEAIDGRSRIVFVLHETNSMELSSVAPKLAKRASISTSQGFKLVCDRILATVINIADQGVSAARESDPTIPFAHFRVIGVLKCENPNCPWKAPEDMMQLLGQDPGSEFTLAKRDGGWYAVCSSCGRIAMGPMDEEDAKHLAASVRIDLWAPETLPYGGEEMGRSSFLELLDEEMKLRRGAKRDFSLEELKGMLEARSKFASKVEAALKSGSITSEQRDELLTLNRKHSFPGG